MDASAGLRALLLRDPAYRQVQLCDAIYSSELLELDVSIKRRAMEAFPVHVKTLDALHLATALAVAAADRTQTVAVFSYDVNMNRAARAVGLSAPWSA